MTPDEWEAARAELRRLGATPRDGRLGPPAEPRSRDEVGRPTWRDVSDHETTGPGGQALEPFGWLVDAAGWTTLAAVTVAACASPWWLLALAVPAVLLGTWLYLDRPR